MEFIYVVYGAIAIAVIFALNLVRIILSLRRVVPTNMVHIVQSKSASTPYGRGKPAGNTYYAWPSWIPVIGVTVSQFQESIFPISLNDYEAYDSARLPFMVDVTAFFRVDDAETVAQRVSNFGELTSQLEAVLQGSVRRILATNPLELIMQERSELGQQFTDEVQKQIKEWGVLPVKTIEFMDIRDSAKGNVISNIMAKEKSRIERESRVAVAENIREAETKEIDARRVVEVQRQDAEQQVGIRTAEKEKLVGIADEQAKQEVLTAGKITTEKEMDVMRVQNVKSAEIAKDVAVVTAEQQKAVTIVAAQANKEQLAINADGQLEAAKRNAEGIKVEGDAKAAAEQAMLLAPVNTQITLAKEIGENDGYQKYLITVKQVEANRDVGLEMAKAFSSADLKVIANSGDIGGGIKNLAGMLSSAGGVNIGAMLEGLSQTADGKALVESVVKRIGGNQE